MHVGLGDILDDDGNIEIPGANGLVVRRGDKAPILVDESDGIDGT